MKNWIILAVLFSYLFIGSTPLYAQRANERWVCLEQPMKDGKPIACNNPAAGCSGKGVTGHRAKLTAYPGKEPLTGVKTYVIECVGGDGTIPQTCTTGDQNADNYVYGRWDEETTSCPEGGMMGDPDKNGLGAKRCCTNDPGICQTLTQEATNLATLAALDYKMQGLFLEGVTQITPPSPMTWETGAFYEWQSYTENGQGRNWKALNYWIPSGAGGGEVGGQQLDTFTFETADKDCAKIYWDPYGRVFDSQTLEPIQGATVTLFEKSGDDWISYNPANHPETHVTNPYSTSKAGYYSFIPEDGEYKLVVTPAIEPELGNIHFNYKKAYYKIYPGETGDVIVEKGAVEYRDIPVNPLVPTNREPEIVDIFEEALDTGELNFQGRTVHPFTKVIILTSKVSTADETKMPLNEIVHQADRDGKFRFTIDQNAFEETAEYVEIYSGYAVEKVDLRLMALRNDNKIIDLFVRLIERFIPSAFAQATRKVYKAEPIPRHIEGYAYDGSSKPIPNATVGVYLSYAKGAYSITTADKNGYYKITSSNLPDSRYEIKYKTPSGVEIKTTTSKFLAQNQKFIVQNNIKTYEPKMALVTDERFRTGSSSKSSVSSTSTSGAGAGSLSQRSVSGRINSASSAKTTGTATPSTSPAANPMILIIILLIILLVGVGAGIVLYMKQKQPASTWQ